MGKKISPHLKLAHEYWKGLLREGDLAIDATCGNGHDTLFLAGLCSVVGLDIQKRAIENTRVLLDKHQRAGLLHQMSHAEIDTLVLPKSPKLIVYNLGYLPHGDKSITTKWESTLESVNKSLVILAPDGVLSITCYPGHDEGQKEERMLEEWADTLPGKVTHHKWPERVRSPSLLWIKICRSRHETLIWAYP